MEIEEILNWAKILENVPDVEPLYLPFEEPSHLREDEIRIWEFEDPLRCAPEILEGFIRFKSPIGRKT